MLTPAPAVVWRQRAKIAPLVPPRVANRLPYFRHYAYSPLPGSSFADQAQAGLSSSTFDLEHNIFGGDSRVGLDEHGAAEVNDIMRREHVSCVLLFCILLRVLTTLQVRPGACNQVSTVERGPCPLSSLTILCRQARYLARNGIDPSGGHPFIASSL